MLEIKKLSFGFSTHKILQSLDLYLGKNEHIAIVGSSGSGKSTLFNIITKKNKPYQGTINFFGKELSTIDYPFVTYMTQDDLLLPWMTLLDNLNFFLKITKKQIPKNTLLDLLELFGLTSSANLYPNELSGGLRQRACFARALLSLEDLLLLDEPFSSLDQTTRLSMHLLYQNFQKNKKFSSLMISHDIEEAKALSTRVLILKEGRLVEL